MTDARPNFFIVGAPRSGTTALYAYLQEHPDVFMPYRKEPHFFGRDLPDRPPVLTPEGYASLFAPGRYARRRGEATVWYLYSESAAEEIHAFTPNAKIIIMLRRPADMLYSLHGLFLFTTWETIEDFGEALEAQEDRRRGRRLPRHTWWPKALQYRWLGDYAPHVERYHRVFGQENVHVVLYDDLRDDPMSVAQGTFSFLGLDASSIRGMPVVNAARVARSRRLQAILFSPAFQRTLAKLPVRAHHLAWRALMRMNIRYQPRPPMDADLERTLTAELEPAVLRLEDVLGRPLPEWKTS